MGCPGMTPVTLPPGKPGRFLFHLAVQLPRRRAACFGANNRYPAPPRRVLQLPSSAIKPWSCPAWERHFDEGELVAGLVVQDFLELMPRTLERERRKDMICPSFDRLSCLQSL